MRHNRKEVIGVCISLLLKNHFAKACFVQKLISLILYSGHASKQVICATDHNILSAYIKTSGSESRGQEEAACIRVFRPMRPLQ